MIDIVEVFVKGGDGGNGVVSFRREKYVPRGGPDGGSGGSGGSVYLEADDSISTLWVFRRQRHFRADDGGDGKGKNRHGKNGEDLVIKVPRGTVVHSLGSQRGDADSKGELVADLSAPGQRVLLADSGRGGRGNATYATSTRQAPSFAQKGAPGAEGWYRLELKLLADVGVVGLPNAGKSSLLAALTSATPKIADYPFTTLEPNLGVVEVGYEAFVMADIPGLIEGAHEGAGLGQDFLKHIQRTKVLVHIVDGSSPHPKEDMEVINRELALFDPDLASKPQLLAINKIDLPQVRDDAPHLADELSQNGQRPFLISALGGDGLTPLVNRVWELLNTTQNQSGPPDMEGFQVFRPAPVDQELIVHQHGEAFMVSGARVERLMSTVEHGDELALARARLTLKRMGLDRLLVRAGAKPGDTVKAGDIEFEWQ